MSNIEAWLRRTFRYKEIGWEDIGERFTRYTVLKTRWFNIYLHQLSAPAWAPECHSHPWWFMTFILWNGYLEAVGGKHCRRRPGMILFRRASFVHNVITPYGVSWSLVFTGPKTRAWGFKACKD